MTAQMPAGRPTAPRAVRSRSFSQVIGASMRRSSASPFAAPRTISIVPSVTMKGTTLSRVMRTPLMKPHRAAAGHAGGGRGQRRELRAQHQRDDDGA